jgi:hypothetical protein
MFRAMKNLNRDRRTAIVELAQAHHDEVEEAQVSRQYNNIVLIDS